VEVFYLDETTMKTIMSFLQAFYQRDCLESLKEKSAPPEQEILERSILSIDISLLKIEEMVKGNLFFFLLFKSIREMSIEEKKFILEEHGIL